MNLNTFYRVNWTSSPDRNEDIDSRSLCLLSSLPNSLNRRMLRNLTKRLDMLVSQNPLNLLYHGSLILQRRPGYNIRFGRIQRVQ